MQHSTRLSGPNHSRCPKQALTLALLAGAPFLLCPATLLASDPLLSVTSQVTPEVTNDKVSPPNIVTGPDFRLLMNMMRKGIVQCGVPRTAVLRWHVQADGLINDYVLHKSSGDSCFDEIVILNAEQVVTAKLRATPGTRNGAAEAAWAPFTVVARD